MTFSKTITQGSEYHGGVGSSNNNIPAAGSGYGTSTFDNRTGSVPFNGGLSITLIAAGVGLQKHKCRIQTYKSVKL